MHPWFNSWCRLSMLQSQSLRDRLPTVGCEKWCQLCKMQRRILPRWSKMRGSSIWSPPMVRNLQSQEWIRPHPYMWKMLRWLCRKYGDRRLYTTCCYRLRMQSLLPWYQIMHALQWWLRSFGWDLYSSHRNVHYLYYRLNLRKFLMFEMRFRMESFRRRFQVSQNSFVWMYQNKCWRRLHRVRLWNK